MELGGSSGLRQQDDGMLLAAAKRAHDMGWYDRAIYAADRTINKHNDTYRFPTPHRSNVTSHSYNAGIDPAWAYGLMRQESRFVNNSTFQCWSGWPDADHAKHGQIGCPPNGETYNPAAGAK